MGREFLLKAEEEFVSCPSPRFRWFTGNHCHPLAGGYITQISSSSSDMVFSLGVYLCPDSPLDKDFGHIGLEIYMTSL